VQLYAPGVKIEQVNAKEARFTVTSAAAAKYLPFTLSFATPARTLDVSFHTTRDSRPRAFGTRRILMPFAKPAAPIIPQAPHPEIGGGNWEAGHALFKGKAACATCHQLRGDGVQGGPDLSNLVHRDYASVLNDIANPNAAINPDAAGYTVTLRNGSAVIATRPAESADELQIAQPGGAVLKLHKSEIAKTEPMPASLMPTGLDKILTVDELRDLMTYLLTESAVPPAAVKSDSTLRE
jgi:putative heme-binding domain-containing protein